MQYEKDSNIGHKITLNQILEYERFLYLEERSENTVKKYIRDLKAFFHYLEGQAVTKDILLGWKKEISASYAPTSVNSMLAAVNGFLDWIKLPELRVKPLKIQRELFTKPEKELTRTEYFRLIREAEKKKNPRLGLVLQVICATGIRVSELRFITVKSIRTGRANVDCKGKKRIVFLPEALCRILRKYCNEQRIRAGSIFITKTGKPLDRSNIWKSMKQLCKNAGVKPGKVFPHNLRHLFARTYHALDKDLPRLADLLGHADINTTRIYIMESGGKHAKRIEQLGLVADVENAT